MHTNNTDISFSVSLTCLCEETKTSYPCEANSIATLTYFFSQLSEPSLNSDDSKSIKLSCPAIEDFPIQG